MSAFNESVVQAADREVEAAIAAVLAAKPGEAVVGVAPAGAGKSHAIGTAVASARREGLRVAVATPTNEQAFALVEHLAGRLPEERVVFVHASTVRLPAKSQRRNAEERPAKEAASAGLVVGTLNKLGDAFARGNLGPFDLLLIDEAYQANAVHYYLVGDLAPRHLLMGDSGQLAPFSSAPEANRWRGLPEDPLLTAVEVLRKNHPGTREFRLPVTRRLDPRAVSVARAFYPDHPFDAAVLPGVRALRLGPASAKRAGGLADAVLDHAAETGWAHVELPPSAVVSADPESIEIIVGLVRRLFERGPDVRCERSSKPKRLEPGQVAVAVSHNDQRSQLTRALEGEGLGGVVVSTANKLQGLTYEVVVAWHPLAGLGEVDAFHLDPGRLCVMLTRHRHACIVVGRAGDREPCKGSRRRRPGTWGGTRTRRSMGGTCTRRCSRPSGRTGTRPEDHGRYWPKTIVLRLSWHTLP